MNDFPRGQYRLLYIDPPWKYKMYSDKGTAKGPDAHYDCMTFEQLAAMRDQIVFATAPDAVIIMWTTFAADDDVDHLQQAMDLMRMWGFQRKTGGPWNKLTVNGKQAFGPGYIYRSAAELFLVGTHGNPTIKNHSTRNSFFTGDVPDDLCQLGLQCNTIRREHSRKPDEMIPMIEALFEGPYLELFSRTERPGWTVWGNQTGLFKPETKKD